MSYKYCNHVKEDGTFCRAAALRGRNYCYFHLRARARRLALAKAQSECKPWILRLPPLEDMHAVQVALMEVLDGLAAGHIEQDRAGLLLYGLQQASTNIKSVGAWLGYSRFHVREDDEFRADNYPGMEEEFDLPKRVDLETQPKVTYPPLAAYFASGAKLPPESVKIGNPAEYLSHTAG